MLMWYKRNKKRKSKEMYEEMYQKNELQLAREKISLQYDLLRSLAK